MSDSRVAGGFSPTIAVYDLRDGSCARQANLSMEVRKPVHGLALWLSR